MKKRKKEKKKRKEDWKKEKEKMKKKKKKGLRTQSRFVLVQGKGGEGATGVSEKEGRLIASLYMSMVFFAFFFLSLSLFTLACVPFSCEE
jgi:hypothetical protein